MTVGWSSRDGSVRGLARGSSEVTPSFWTHTRLVLWGRGGGQSCGRPRLLGGNETHLSSSRRGRGPSLGDRAGERAPGPPRGISAWHFASTLGLCPAKGECGQQPAGRGRGAWLCSEAQPHLQQLSHGDSSCTCLSVCHHWCGQRTTKGNTSRAPEPLPVGRPRRPPRPGQRSAAAFGFGYSAFCPSLFDDQKGETKQECLTSECHSWVCGSAQPAGSERPRPNQPQIKQGFKRVFGP